MFPVEEEIIILHRKFSESESFGLRGKYAFAISEYDSSVVEVWVLRVPEECFREVERHGVVRDSHWDLDCRS